MKELLGYILLIVGILVLSIFVVLLIGNSDLPDWLKFYLLS